jgi:hypothetical protein
MLVHSVRRERHRTTQRGRFKYVPRGGPALALHCAVRAEVRSTARGAATSFGSRGNALPGDRLRFFGRKSPPTPFRPSSMTFSTRRPGVEFSRGRSSSSRAVKLQSYDRSTRRKVLSRQEKSVSRTTPLANGRSQCAGQHWR